MEGYAFRWGATALLYVDRGVVGGNTVLARTIQQKTSHTHTLATSSRMCLAVELSKPAVGSLISA